jgi:hypothetical protein
MLKSCTATRSATGKEFSAARWAAGRKLESLDDLPGYYLSMAQEKHAKFIADPVASLEPLTRDL